MQRYFVDKKENGSFILSQEQAHHILRVMRMNVKDEITICYNEEVYLCEITSTSPLTVQEKEKLHEDHELKNNVTLFYCLPKGDKLDLVIQKASELGVSEIVLVQSKWCVCKYKKEDYKYALKAFLERIYEIKNIQFTNEIRSKYSDELTELFVFLL